MRKLPIYFLVDLSESMAGEPIQLVQDGMKAIVQELRNNPYALENVSVSVIAFAEKAVCLSPPTELYEFYPPAFPIIGTELYLGNALNFLMDDYEKTILESKEYWKPIVFLFTDRTPTDNTNSAFVRWNSKYRKSARIVAISIGDNVNTQLLGEISNNVFCLNHTDNTLLQVFFKRLTASIISEVFS